MRIIGPLDQKPFYGVAVAVIAGLMVGGAMKPTLRDSDDPEGPQQLGPKSGERIEFVDSRSSFAAYRYGIPEWVIGTDWLRPANPEPEPMAEEPEPAFYEVAAWEPAEPRQVASSEPEPEPAVPSYPSMGGDILHGMGAEPPAPDDASEPPAEPLAG
jgi:hypothetical protein